MHDHIYNLSESLGGISSSGRFLVVTHSQKVASFPIVLHLPLAPALQEQCFVPLHLPLCCLVASRLVVELLGGDAPNLLPIKGPFCKKFQSPTAPKVTTTSIALKSRFLHGRSLAAALCLEGN